MISRQRRLSGGASSALNQGPVPAATY